MADAVFDVVVIGAGASGLASTLATSGFLPVQLPVNLLRKWSSDASP